MIRRSFHFSQGVTVLESHRSLRILQPRNELLLFSIWIEAETQNEEDTQWISIAERRKRSGMQEPITPKIPFMNWKTDMYVAMAFSKINTFEIWILYEKKYGKFFFFPSHNTGIKKKKKSLICISQKKKWRPAKKSSSYRSDPG